MCDICHIFFSISSQLDLSVFFFPFTCKHIEKVHLYSEIGCLAMFSSWSLMVSFLMCTISTMRNTYNVRYGLNSPPSLIVSEQLSENKPYKITSYPNIYAPGFPIPRPTAVSAPGPLATLQPLNHQTWPCLYISVHPQPEKLYPRETHSYYSHFFLVKKSPPQSGLLLASSSKIFYLSTSIFLLTQ